MRCERLQTKRFDATVLERDNVLLDPGFQIFQINTWMKRNTVDLYIEHKMYHENVEAYMLSRR